MKQTAPGEADEPREVRVAVEAGTFRTGHVVVNTRTGEEMTVTAVPLEER